MDCCKQANQSTKSLVKSLGTAHKSHKHHHHKSCVKHVMTTAVTMREGVMLCA